MDPTYWHQRWAEGRTGWQQPQVNRLLERHWPQLHLVQGSRVFVPLCGKSLDMEWLLTQGHAVLGVEISRQACEGFFADRGLRPEIDEHGAFRRYRASRLELWAGDVFDLTRTDLEDCIAIYDRAALIALPPAQRARYAEVVYRRLPTDCRALLITLEYPWAEKAGPPFSVEESEVHRLFEPDWHISLQQRCDILDQQPGFQAEGVTRLHTCAYRLRKRLG